MAIVSELPFKLQIIKRFPSTTYQDGVVFFTDAKEMWKKELMTLRIEENDEIEILFDAEDEGAKLYLEALDIVPLDDRKIAYDSEGRIYRMPSSTPFILYKGNCGYDALCVDVFQISVYCNETWYYGSLQVMPKPMNMNEWIMMKDDLEKEMIGLAQDIVRRNIGYGNTKSGNIPPKILYDFIVIKKYAQAVLGAILDIAENPRCEIATQYKKVANDKNCRLDEESVRRYATRAGSEATYNVPVKVVNYDIQDNRILKNIIIDYEKRLNIFMELLEELQDYTTNFDFGRTLQYKNEWEKSIIEFKYVAQKLRKITSLLKTQEWYFEVGKISQPYIPHSFIMDTRYNTLYQMHLELKRETFKIEFDPEFSYTWKRSSYLYEMWCYFKLIHLLSQQYEMSQPDWAKVFSGKILFPFLTVGTSIELTNENVRIQVVFDKPLVFESKKTDIYCPLYVAKTQEYSRMHNRPDILIYVYDIKNGWYLGSIVLECKYRKMHSIETSGQRGSVGQLQAYYNNTRSEYLFGGLGKKLNMRPVKRVIVLTPDVKGDGKYQDDFSILFKSFKPADTDEWDKSLIDEVNYNINELVNVSRVLQH